jgi:hypothetical protein
VLEAETVLIQQLAQLGLKLDLFFSAPSLFIISSA